MAHSANYEILEEEEINESLGELGDSIQLTTFKTNQEEIRSHDTIKPEPRRIGIACVGACNFRDKIVYVRHYVGKKPSFFDSNCILTAETLVKDTIWCQENNNAQMSPSDCDQGQASRSCKMKGCKDDIGNYGDSRKVPLEIHLTVLGEYLPDRLAEFYLAHSDSKVGIIGVIVFSPASRSTLRSAVDWKNVVEASFNGAKNIPIVLLIENIASSVDWIGEGKFVEDEEAMEHFISENGFVKWFQILRSDWKLGEKNVFGRAVDAILQEEFAGTYKS